MAGILAGTVAWAAVPAGYVDASSYGYNVTDATAALQAAINSGQNVYVPKMASDWIISPVTLTRSNQTILFESGVVVSAKAGSFLGTTDCLFQATHVSNVVMSGYGATFRMNQSDYTQPPYAKGEWRSGIACYTVDNFQIEGFTIQNTGGDGIYVGSWFDATPTWSTNVRVKDVLIKNAYRNGISITSGDGVTVDNAVILNTGGTAPQAGIDLEPDIPQHPIRNVTIKNSIFSGNAGLGMQTYFTNADPVGMTATFENVTVINNGDGGLGMGETLPGLTVKNSIFVGNQDGGTWSLNHLTDFHLNSIDYSLVANNANGNIRFPTYAGTGTLSSFSGPLFYSMDPNSPDFLYLHPNVSNLIAQGADDGGYMGARPVFGTVPEPAALSWLGISSLFLSCRRAHPKLQKYEKGVTV